MGYNYSTRQKFAEDMNTKWLKKNGLKSRILTAELKGLMTEFGQEKFTWKLRQTANLNQNAFLNSHRESADLPLSAYMQKYCRPLVRLYVPKQMQDAYYAYIDRLAEFPYTTGPGRRTMRCDAYWMHFDEALELLSAFRILECFGTTPEGFVRGRMSEEAIDYAANEYLYGMSDLLACALNAGDAGLT